MIRRIISWFPIVVALTLVSVAGWGGPAGQAAVIPSTSAGPARSVWIHAGLFGADQTEAVAKMQATFADYRRAGISSVYCFFTLPDEHRFGWDLLGVLVREAHARGLQAHAVLSPGYPVALEGEVREHLEWLITGTMGEIKPQLNLAEPGARQYFLRRVAAVLAYDVDGIHLDYARFPLGQSFSYDAPTIAAFKKQFGESPLEVSRDAGNMIWCEWVEWNARQVTLLVREVREAVKKKDSRLVLSAAVFPNPALAAFEIGQDWQTWASEGLVDALCPMLYTNNHTLFRQYIKRAVEVAAGRVKVYAGIASASSHNKNTPAGLAQQQAIALEEHADGVVVFSGYSLDRAYLDALAGVR
jgi:uncharacterized lipoprotein YddW (UPF0748 family)